MLLARRRQLGNVPRAFGQLTKGLAASAKSAADARVEKVTG